MAMYWGYNFSSKIMNYLLVDAWDIENSASLQNILWLNFLTSFSGLNGSWRSPDLDFPDEYLHWVESFTPNYIIVLSESTLLPPQLNLFTMISLNFS